MDTESKLKLSFSLFHFVSYSFYTCREYTCHLKLQIKIFTIEDFSIIENDKWNDKWNIAYA